MANPFEVVPSEGYITIKLNGHLEAESAKQFEKEVPNIIGNQQKDVVINCENLSEITQHWIRCLMDLHIKLKAQNKKLRLILASEKILRILKEGGVDQALKVAKTLRAALVEFGLVTPMTLDVNFINPFLQATIKTLKVQAQVESKPGKIYRKEAKDHFSGDISGVIGMVSDAFTGSVVISFPEKTFLAVMSRMLGEDYKEVNSDIVDGAGEMTNIIFGGAKSVLNQKGYGIKTAIPSVITGKDHSVQNLTKGPRVVVPFESDAGNFFVEISLSEEI